MINKASFTVLLASVAAVTAGLLSAGSFLLIRSCRSDQDVDSFIRTESLGQRVIIVRLGYDAVTAIDTHEGIIVVDAGISHTLTAKYRGIIERSFGKTKFACLINTHSHPDHVGGNQVFQELPIIGHQNIPAEMEGFWQNRGLAAKRMQEIAGQRLGLLRSLKPGTEEWREIFCKQTCARQASQDLLKDRILTVPTITFPDSLIIQKGDLTLFFFYFGPAHSKSDILVHVPQLKLLMSGDLFSSRGHPSFDGELAANDTVRRRQSVEWLRSHRPAIETVVGGHGQVMTRSDLDVFLEQLVPDGPG